MSHVKCVCVCVCACIYGVLGYYSVTVWLESDCERDSQCQALCNGIDLLLCWKEKDLVDGKGCWCNKMG